MCWLCDRSLSCTPALPLDGCPMFADFRVHGLKTIIFQCFHHRLHLLTGRKKKDGLPPDFLWSFVALANFMRLSLLKAARRGHVRCSVQEIRVAHLVQPMYAKVREHGAPVQGARLGGKPETRMDEMTARTELSSFISLLTRHR